MAIHILEVVTYDSDGGVAVFTPIPLDSSTTSSEELPVSVSGSFVYVAIPDNGYVKVVSLETKTVVDTLLYDNDCNNQRWCNFLYWT